MSSEEDVDAVESVDAVAGRQDPLVGEEGAAAEEGVSALVHEEAGHPGVLVRRGLATSGDAGVSLSKGTGDSALSYRKKALES